MSLERLRLQNRNWTVDALLMWRSEGYLDLDAPYQRGVAWGPVRQRNYIRSIFMEIPLPSLVVSSRIARRTEKKPLDCRMVVIDGKQRITSMLRFLDDQLAIPGEWFDMPGMVRFSDLAKKHQFMFMHSAMPTAEVVAETIEEEQEIFELINFGGVPQGEIDDDILDNAVEASAGEGGE